MSTYAYKAISNLSVAEEIQPDDILIISQKNIDNQLISKQMRVMDACNYISSNISSAINSKCEQYLPLSGGNTSPITGTIYVNSSIALRQNNEHQPLTLIGGNNNNTCAKLKLYNDSSTNIIQGGFELQASISSLNEETGNIEADNKNFRGYSDGRLTWNNQNIVRKVNGILADDQGNITINTVTSAERLTTPRTIFLGGSLTGSTSFDGSSNVTINATVKDNSHKHTISNIDDLQTQLNNKLDKTSNAASASKLQTPRTIFLGGSLTGSTSFDGSSNVTINATVKDNSHKHTISNIDDLQDNLNNKLNTSNIVDLSDHSESTSDVPNCKSVVDWCDSHFLKSVGFDDPTEVITMLQSMMSESNMVCYVDQINGNDSNDGSIDKPFKTIYKAVQTANKRRFIGNSQCYIRLLSDITLTLNSTGTTIGELVNGNYHPVVLYHPDLVQSKYITFSGWDKTTDAYTFRTIYCPLYNMTRYYISVVTLQCLCHLKYLNFQGDIPNDNIKNGIAPCTSYTVINRSIEPSTIENCNFYNLFHSIVDVRSITNVNIRYCWYGIYTQNIPICYVYGRFNLQNCRCVSTSVTNIMFTGENPRHFVFSVYSKFLAEVSSGGSASFSFMPANFIQKKYWPIENGQIVAQSDGEFRPNEGYEDTYIKIGFITLDSDNNEVIEDIDYSTVDKLLSGLFNTTGKLFTGYGGYTNNGFVKLITNIGNITKLLDYGKNFDWNGNKIT